MSASPFKDVDIFEWMDRFNVYYVDDPELHEHVAVHSLTALGKKRKLKPFDVWVSTEFKDYTDLLVLHEVIENYLRRKGWRYQESHEYACRKVYEMFGHTRDYKALSKELRHY